MRVCERILNFAVFLFSGKGVFYINGIFPFESIDKINYQSGIMMGEAMKYAVHSVNNNSQMLFGYTLEINEIYGSNDDDDVQDNILQTFLARIPFLIGPYSSETSYIASILTNTFRQIAVSYSAVFSDFDSRGMSRTVPSNFYRVQALLDLVERLEWNYLAVISSYSYDGERDAKNFISRLSSIDVCLGEQIVLPRQSLADSSSFNSAVTTIHKDQRIRAIILFTINDDSRRIMMALKENKLEHFYRIICAFGCTNYKEVVEDVEDVALGTISLDIHYKREYEFDSYFLSRTPKTNSDTQFIKFWEKVFNCKVNDGNVNIINGSGIPPCTGDEKLEEGKGFYPLTPVHTVIDAVFSIAYGLHQVIQIVCHKEQKWMANSTECVIKPYDRKMYSHMIFNSLFAMSYPDGTLKNFRSFTNECQYDIHLFVKEKEKYKSVHIGKWVVNKTDEDQGYDSSELDALFEVDLTRLTKNGSNSHFRALCSDNCYPGYVKIRDQNALKSQCCWICQKCPPNNININDTCTPCDKTEMAVDSTCTELPKRYLDISTNSDDPFHGIILFLSIVGLSLTLFIVVLFLKFNGNRIVRAYGRDLCYMILTGIAILFICPFPFLVRPTTIACIFRGSLPGIAFLTCYAPLFLKINRIYRIFLHAQTSVARPALVSSKSLLLCSFGIVALQFLLSGVWFVSKMPSPEFVLPSNREYIILTCKGESSPALMLLNLLLSVIFMVSSTVLAFKTRHFPKNYNESKYIGITLYITCVAWALFFPGYFFASSGNMEFWREYLMCIVCVLVGYITLLGLFGPKVKLLLCTSKGKLNKKSNGPPSYSFSFDPTHKHETNGLTMEHNTQM